MGTPDNEISTVQAESARLSEEELQEQAHFLIRDLKVGLGRTNVLRNAVIKCYFGETVDEPATSSDDYRLDDFGDVKFQVDNTSYEIDYKIFGRDKHRLIIYRRTFPGETNQTFEALRLVSKRFAHSPVISNPCIEYDLEQLGTGQYRNVEDCNNQAALEKGREFLNDICLLP